MTPRLPPRCKAITFDVGGTLIEPWPSVGRVYVEVAREQGIEADVDTVTRQFVSAWKAKKAFDYSRDHWHQLVRQSFAGFGEISPRLFEAIYGRFAQADAWRIYDDVIPALTHLKQRGIRLGIISNWDERLRPLLQTLGLAQYFEVLTISAEIGAHKPAPRIYHAALEHFALSPAQVLHVGDSHAEDILGAADAGIHALKIIRGTPSTSSSFDLLSLTELLPTGPIPGSAH